MLTRRQTIGVVAAYAILSIVWGTTYTAIRVIVQAVAPFHYASVRFGISGLLMLGLCALWRLPRPTRYAPLALQGFLFIFLGNGALSFAEQTVPSGIAAILSAVSTLFTAFLSWMLLRERLSALGWLGMLIGIGGVAILLLDKFTTPAGMHGELVLAVSCIAWSYGTIYMRRKSVDTHPLTVATYQMLFGSLFMGAAALVLGDSIRGPITLQVVIAFWYLVLIGGCVGFFCFAYLVSKIPAAKASTFGFINPVVGLLVGSLVLGETLAPHHILGAGVVLAGVVIVHLSRG